MTAKMQTGSGFRPFRHYCHYLINRLEGKEDTHTTDISRPYFPTDLSEKVVTVVTDSRKRPSDAAFGRHYLVFQVVTRHHLVVTD